MAATLVAVFAAWPVVAQAACGGLLPGVLTPKCPPPPPPAPDPGGVETPDQPVPPPGKAFGFSSALYVSGLSSTPEAELDRAAAAGATVHRMALAWRIFQPSAAAPPMPEAMPGNSVERVDRLYAAAQARGIRPIFIMSKSPLWATRYRQCGLLDLQCMSIAQSSHNLPPDAAGLGPYQRFVNAVKTRWPNAIVEPWNEPNHYWADPNYQGVRAFAATPQHLAKMQCAASAGSKAVNADPVLAAGWADHQVAEYVRLVYEANGDECWDLFNTHLYTGTETNYGQATRLAMLLRMFRGLRTEYADTDPIWVTETGFTTTGEGSPRVTPEAQADGSRRLYNKLITMSDIGAVVFHTLRDAPFPDPPYNSWRHHEYGFGFLYDDWRPKPVYCHFTARAGTPAC